MAYALTWMRNCLLDAGLKVAEDTGWEGRGREEMGTVRGVMVHHTVGPLLGNMPSLGTLRSGRPDLRGPLANLGLGRDGTYYLIAAGRANHAGGGLWRGVETGNSSFIGIEAENAGTMADFPWPLIQREALVRGAAALLKHAGLSSDWVTGHKEYALPKGRKVDPLLDMDAVRRDVAACQAGVEQFHIIPAVEPDGTGQRRATLRRDHSNDAQMVRAVQRALGLVADGLYGTKTEAAVRAWQMLRGLVPDGIFGPRSWAMLDALQNQPSVVVR